MTQARDLADGKFDTNTLVVDAANNRVGVNTVSPNTSLEVAGTGSTTMRLHRDNASGGGGIDFFNNTQQVANINAGSGNLTLKADPTNAAGSSMISFETDGSEVGRWLAGGGLTFNGDTAAANALDDYEEGTWTPTDATGSGVTWTTHSARYTKIGRIVNVQLYITGVSSSGVSAGTKISGLPYNVVNHGWTSSALSTNAGQSSSQDIVARSVSNSDDIDFQTASTDTGVAWSHFHGAFMVFKLTYHVS